MFVKPCVALIFFILCSSIDGRPAGSKKADIQHVVEVAKSNNGGITFIEEKPATATAAAATVPVQFENRFGVRVGTCPIGYVKRGVVCYPA
ncbi:unnamed protein product, partial [Brenthis ino]